MENESVLALSIYLREIIEDIIDDLYDNDTELRDLSSDEKIDYLINFLVGKHKDDEKYFGNYKKFIGEDILKYKDIMIRFFITDFYEYQTVITERGRQSDQVFKHYNFITNNFDNPQKIVYYFSSKKNLNFNRAIVNNYIIFQNENRAFFYKAIKRQIENNNIIKLNKINPFYILESSTFLTKNKVIETEVITDEILQSYYDEYAYYMKTQITDEKDIDEIEDAYDEEEPDYTVNENGEIEFTDDEYTTENDNDYSLDEDIIYRLLKLRIMQKYISEDNIKLFDVIGYIIGNVYENMIYDANNISKNRIESLKNSIYLMINESTSEQLIQLFINDDDFSILILKYFMDYNEYEDMERSKQKRDYIEQSDYLLKVKKLNKHYNEESEIIKEY